MTSPTEKLTWEQLEEKGLIEKYGEEYYFTDKMAETIKQGELMQDYYRGEHTIIRTDKLHLLIRDQKTLRQQQRKTTAQTPKHCQQCGTKIKTMPCDQELTYCPQCDIPHE